MAEQNEVNQNQVEQKEVKQNEARPFCCEFFFLVLACVALFTGFALCLSAIESALEHKDVYFGDDITGGWNISIAVNDEFDNLIGEWKCPNYRNVTSFYTPSGATLRLSCADGGFAFDSAGEGVTVWCIAVIFDAICLVCWIRGCMPRLLLFVTFLVALPLLCVMQVAITDMAWRSRQIFTTTRHVGPDLVLDVGDVLLANMDGTRRVVNCAAAVVAFTFLVLAGFVLLFAVIAIAVINGVFRMWYRKRYGTEHHCCKRVDESDTVGVRVADESNVAGGNEHTPEHDERAPASVAVEVRTDSEVVSDDTK